MHAINWFEIPVIDMARACRFYEQILAVSLRLDESFPGMRMAVLPYSDGGVGGGLIEFEHAKPHADGVRIYLNGGEDLAPILARVEAVGGRIIMPKTFLSEDIGYIGMFGDSEGNIIGLHSRH